MAGEIIVPSLGESVSEATVSKWFKKVGDSVKADEPLVELETDKVIIPPGVDGPAGKPRDIPKPFDPFMVPKRTETTIDANELRRLQREGQNWIEQQRPAVKK